MKIGAATDAPINLSSTRTRSIHRVIGKVKMEFRVVLESDQWISRIVYIIGQYGAFAD